MGINKINGTPWHAERVHREDGDERRYKGRCKFYAYDGDYCTQRSERCLGSAHCDYYEALSEKEFERKRKAQAENKQQKTSSLAGEDDVYWY